MDSSITETIKITKASSSDINTLVSFDEDAEDRFKAVEHDMTMAEYDYRFKFEQTVFTIVPTVTIEKIERTIPSYDNDNPYDPGRAMKTIDHPDEKNKRKLVP